jgi:predicted TIM-barrel fold metal-dependent hydrolase
MKTAVEWLVETMYKETYPFNPKYSKIFEQAKEMEKEQIMNSYYTGHDDVKDNPDREAEQYYNETFKSE